jgi:hypothetical protein
MTQNGKNKMQKHKKNVLHRPGIEPGASRIDLLGWQRLILPLNHRCDIRLRLYSIDERLFVSMVYIAPTTRVSLQTAALARAVQNCGTNSTDRRIAAPPRKS